METRTQTQTQTAKPKVSTTSTKKRKARPSASADGDSGDDGKKRGRPRVDKQDESAADRRRTQIRMAQRAYRQRKESSLEELRKRVSELTNTVELMNKVFTSHHDRLLHLGLPDRQLEDVRETAAQFETLMKCVRSPSEDDSDEIPVRDYHRESTGSVHDGSAADTLHATLEPKNVPSWIDRSAVLQQQQLKQRDPTSVGMGYTMYMQDPESMDVGSYDFPSSEATSTVLHTSSEEPRQHQSHHYDQQEQNYNVYRVEVPEFPTIPASISPPRTYSFQETTFGRRLHRAAVEQGYQLLLDPQRRPATYDRVFRLSFMSRSREKVIMQMKALLERGPHENLDQETPLIHVGGAGTHYPRRDPFGNMTPKKESWHMGIVGPQALALLENSAKDNISVDMTVDIAGFEGEWLDPYDVEGYLEEKGIFIDPTSSFAEVEVVLQSPPPSHASGTGTDSTPYSSGDSETPPTIFQRNPPPRPFDREQMHHLSNLGIDAGAYNAMATVSTSSTVGFSDASTGSWMNFLQPGETMKTHMPLEPTLNAGVPALTWEGSKSTEDYMPELGSGSDRSAMGMSEMRYGPGGLRKTVIIDVAKFVKILIVSGVCLSRTPGYKRRDVDRALALASFDAY